MMAYHIKDWDRLYENNKSREVETLSYFMQPNKLVGECLGYVKMQPDGLELLGTLHLIKCVASTTQPAKWRGWLIRNGTVMDATRIAALTGLPVEKIARALEFFSTPPMDWLLHEEWTGDTKATPRRQPGDTKTTPHCPPAASKSAVLSTDKGLSTDGTGTEGEREKVSFAQVQASRTRAGALLAQIRELEARKTSLEPEERAALRKKKRELEELQKKQAAGDFTAEQGA